MYKLRLIVSTLILLLSLTGCRNAGYDSEQSYVLQEDPETFATWQEAYAEVLQKYMYTIMPSYTTEDAWYFLLHDINQDGIPELFIIMRYITGHVSYRYVYTFTDGKVVWHDFVGYATDGGLFAPGYGRPWVVMFLAAGSGGWYIRVEMDDDMLVRTHNVFSNMSDEGFEAEMNDPYNFIKRNYMQYYRMEATQNWDEREAIALDEFEYLFGCYDKRKWLAAMPITEVNINEAIYS